jgi:hypothetical protein
MQGWAMHAKLCHDTLLSLASHCLLPCQHCAALHTCNHRVILLPERLSYLHAKVLLHFTALLWEGAAHMRPPGVMLHPVQRTVFALPAV